MSPVYKKRTGGIDTAQRTGWGNNGEMDISVMSHTDVARRRALERAWNYRGWFEWKLFGQVEVEAKGSAFVWTIGLVIIPVHVSYLSVLERRRLTLPWTLHSQ